MAAGIFSGVAVLLSAAATAVAGYTFYRYYNEMDRIESRLDSVQQDVKGLQVEAEAFNGVDDEEEEELFEENVKNLAEKLFVLLKTKHNMEGVTTYKEMTENLENLDATDDELKEDLLNFYESAIRLEYSDEELSDREREKMKQTAVNLIKKTGQGLEELE